MEITSIVLITIAATGLVLLGAGNFSQARRRDTVRLKAVERKLDLIIAHLEIDDPLPGGLDVVSHLENGEFIQAIKVYRDNTGAGLAEAKAAVEEIRRQRGLDPK
jgi:ribosomal protein L7/L12